MTIKKRDLRRITKDYEQLLPGWKMVRDDILYREKACVMQGILFDRSSGDDYTPYGYLRILAAPGGDISGMESPQDIKYPNGASQRKVKLTNHERDRDLIYSEICKQIRPPVLRPLEPEEVLAFCEQEAAPTLNEAHSLAALNAYLGYYRKAAEWIDRFKQLAEGLRTIWNESIASEYWFIEALSMWLQIGIARQKLEVVVMQERTRLGLSDSERKLG